VKFRRSSEAVGRIHFAGNHADNLPWGLDAATRSANLVAQIIHDAGPAER
jgi:monoamine oxidase